MRPTPKQQFNPDLIAAFIASGKLQVLPAGNALKSDDGENWQQVNRKTYLIKLDKEAG